jgi:hypothetical protein
MNFKNIHHTVLSTLKEGERFVDWFVAFDKESKHLTYVDFKKSAFDG